VIRNFLRVELYRLLSLRAFVAYERLNSIISSHFDTTVFTISNCLLSDPVIEEGYQACSSKLISF